MWLYQLLPMISVSSLWEMAASRGSKISNLISEEDIIKTDATILSIILHNLISNASKFTYNGSIDIQAIKGNNHYSISVKDNGIGLNREQLNRVKQILLKKELTTPNPASNESGNGLGYIIISELSEMVNGSLSIESELGKGTTVTLTLKDS